VSGKTGGGRNGGYCAIPCEEGQITSCGRQLGIDEMLLWVIHLMESINEGINLEGCDDMCSTADSHHHVNLP